MSISKKSILSVSLFVLLLWGVVLSTFATPPLSPYTVTDNATDPTCAPGSANCYVSSVTADNGLTATGSNVQLGGTLLQDTVIDNNGFKFTNSFTDDGTFAGVPIDYSIENGGTRTIATTGQKMPTGMFTELPVYELYAGIGFREADQGPSPIMYEETYGLYKAFFFGDQEAWVRAYDSTNQTSGSLIARANESVLSFDDSNLSVERNLKVNTDGLTFTWSNSLPNSDYIFPNSRGTIGQVLTTDGAGQLSWETAGGSSGWSLTGNAGTDGGITNFIGTTDAQDFMVKTNGNQVALFGQNGNVAIGGAENPFYPAPSAAGDHAIALGTFATAGGHLSMAFGFLANASGENSYAFGINNGATSSGSGSVAFGDNTIASGNKSYVFGRGTRSVSGDEITFGLYNTNYSPLNISSNDSKDRLFSVGNGAGLGSEHNAYTLFKDGSFAYNDDNFQNDNPGTEQNMFYFNYGNHDGNGTAQTKKVIRFGSVSSTEGDINSVNVGDKSIAIGFAFPGYGVSGPIASGFGSTAFGAGSIASNTNSTAFNLGTASGVNSIAFGGIASGQYSFTFGYKSLLGAPFTNTEAIGESSYAFGSSSQARGKESYTFGSDLETYSFNEIVLGRENTTYVPNDTENWINSDRLLTIANGLGFGTPSDALTILKSGETGIAIDNFEANTNGNIFQVGDGTTGIIGYVDNGTGNWVAVSDERKKDNITDLTYGLDTINKLHPVSFDYNRNNEHTIGFLAQEVKDIIPEAVFGSEEKGYGMSYQVLTPALVKAIQEMDLKITDIGNMETPNTWRDSLIVWFESTTNGIRSLVVHDKICVDDQCLTKDDIKVLLEIKNGNTPTVPNNPTPSSTPDLTPPSDPLTCTAPQVINQVGDACIDPEPAPVSEETPPTDTPPTEESPTVTE